MGHGGEVVQEHRLGALDVGVEGREFQLGWTADQLLFGRVNEVTSFAVRTESLCVESPAKFRLVLGVSAERAQFGHAVRKLTLLTVLARAVLFECATQFRLVP